MELDSKNLNIVIGFTRKATNTLILKCMMEVDDIVKTFGSRGVNMNKSKTCRRRLFVKTIMRITLDK